ncbi:MAG: glycerate kinase [Nitrosomonas sp.]|nr:MAG: glycerate kinase [Nitrosomonas sp.]
MNPCNFLLESFSVAVKAADPLHVLPQQLPDPPKGRTLVVGAGKAAAAMALAVEDYWPASAHLEGLVITRYGHKLPTRRISVIEAGHPIPDINGERASRQILSAVGALRSEDLLLCLWSGGGSSLLALPIAGVSLQELKDLTLQLLKCGASIQEINTVRKHLSAIQGGKLAAACKAPILALIISDVTGDEVTHIASGPCSPDPTTLSDALAVLDRYDLNVSEAVTQIFLTSDSSAETPKPGSSAFNNVENRIIANAHQSLIASQNYFQSVNLNTLVLGDTVTGESREIAKSYAALVREICFYPQSIKTPIVLLSGGETTVTIKGDGRGGRNSEFLLSLLIELGGLERVHALACDTDGIDGTENNAGAFITPDSLIRAGKLGLNAASFLLNNDAYTFFEHLNSLVITGPTYTNVNDYRAIIVT